MKKSYSEALVNLSKNPLQISAIYFVLFIVMQLTNWRPIKYWGLRGDGTNFIDSGQVINWTQCYKEVGDQIFASSGKCSGYIYGKIIPLFFSFFPGSENLSNFLGYFFLLLIALVLGSVTSHLQAFSIKVLTTAIFISPPVLLLAERGNFDSLMLCLLFAGGLLYFKKNYFLSFLTLALSAFVKFYTLPVLLTFLFRPNKSKVILLFIPTFIFTLLLTVYEMSLIKSKFPSDSTYKFGMSIWVRYLPEDRIPFNISVLANLVGIFVLILISLFVMACYKSKFFITEYAKSNQFDQNSIIFSFFFITHAACFFGGMSYDYRLIFLAITGLYFLNLKISNGNLENTIKILLVITMWLSYPSGGLQPIGDLATSALTVILLFEFIKINFTSFIPNFRFKAARA